jgi:hypothetical protein
VAGIFFGTTLVSRDSGVTWAATSGNGGHVASSADGSVLAVGDGEILLSTNSGTSWSFMFGEPFGGPLVPAIACSADGLRLAALVAWMYQYILVWTNVTDLTPSEAPVAFSYSANALFDPGSVASSSDGRTLVAIGNGYAPGSNTASGVAYVSTNSGAAWATTSLCNSTWTTLWSVACSADGSKMVAAIPGDTFYASTNCGANWDPLIAPSNSWSAVASSADGGRLVAVANGGGIYTWQATVAPRLKIRQSGEDIVVSWTIPSSSSGLQQSPSIASAQWSDVPVQPTLNLSNLENEVMLSPSGAPAFYRLRGSGQ